MIKDYINMFSVVGSLVLTTCLDLPNGIEVILITMPGSHRLGMNGTFQMM